jgi:hypothetical protein
MQLSIFFSRVQMANVQMHGSRKVEGLKVFTLCLFYMQRDIKDVLLGILPSSPFVDAECEQKQKTKTGIRSAG